MDFVPPPRGILSPPAPWVLVPFSLLERPLEQDMLVLLGPAEPRGAWHGDRAGDLIFHAQD